MTAVVATAVAAAVAAASTVAAAAVLMAVALTMMSVMTAAAGGGGDGCGGGAETVMTAAATAGVKIQQSTSNGSVEGGRWTQACQRVVMNNNRAWSMMRAETKRAARERATVTRVAGEQWQQW
jgi:hypothetical protein